LGFLIIKVEATTYYWKKFAVIKYELMEVLINNSFKSKVEVR
jgi:hypothetical protein